MPAVAHGLRLRCCCRCRLVRAGLAGRGVNDDSRIVVVAHELGVGGLELPDQAVENFRQRFVRRIKLVAQLLRHRCAGSRIKLF